MKAVIMAGGEGTRLKSITGELPKPMVPLLGRPMMEHILLLLKKHGITEICAAVKYRHEDISSYFGDGSRLGVHLQYRVEEQALGTAGGVKNCAGFYGEEDVLVISGDAACDFDLSSLIRAHKEGSSAVTMALYKHPEPLSYGLTVTDSEGRVRAFIEKPDWPRVVTDLVNTGIYVLSPGAMSLVPEGQPYDFAKDLFPELLRRGERLTGLAMEGYWCDVGTPLSYYQCCVDALKGRLQLDIPPDFRPAAPAEAPESEEEGLDCPCKDRARLMGTLAELMMDMGADYADGIRLHGKGYEMHISPSAVRSAVHVAVNSPDAEFARELALSAKDLIQALEL